MSLIYHLAPATRWHTWSKDKPYLPSQYDDEGFIHCTSGDELMVKVANRFYKNTSGDYVLLGIDTTKLDESTSPIKWEKATDFDSLFPHIYGPIDHKAVVEVRLAQRTDDGTFVGWSKS
jgi:uncharacterized protein (DUF952 family)